jgi:hypothetical protein
MKYNIIFIGFYRYVSFRVNYVYNYLYFIFCMIFVFLHFTYRPLVLVVANTQKSHSVKDDEL